MAMPLWMIANIRILMSCRPNFQHVRSRARSHGPVPRPTIRTITRASWLPSKMTCAKKRWRRRKFEAISARVGNMQARWLRLTVRDSRTPTTRTQKLSRRLSAPEPAQALQEAAQDLAGAGAHVERQGDRVVDHNLGRQVALALARPAGLGQDPADPVRRKRPGNHAEADVVAQTDASRKAGTSTSHRSRSLKTRPTASAFRMPK